MEEFDNLTENEKELLQIIINLIQRLNTFEYFRQALMQNFTILEENWKQIAEQMSEPEIIEKLKNFGFSFILKDLNKEEDLDV